MFNVKLCLSAVFRPLVGATAAATSRVVKLKDDHEMERQTRSKRKVRFEEPPVADVRTSRRKAAALEPVVVEETAVPGEATLVEVRVAPARLRTLWCLITTHARVCVCRRRST